MVSALPGGGSSEGTVCSAFRVVCCVFSLRVVFRAPCSVLRALCSALYIFYFIFALGPAENCAVGAGDEEEADAALGWTRAVALDADRGSKTDRRDESESLAAALAKAN